MDVYIYFYSELPTGRRAFEDSMAGRIQPWARVSGGGTGVEGSNIDLEILDRHLSKESVLGQIKAALRQLKAPADTVISIDGEEDHPL